jgi:hypothetical protein
MSDAIPRIRQYLAMIFILPPWHGDGIFRVRAQYAPVEA